MSHADNENVADDSNDGHSHWNENGDAEVAVVGAEGENASSSSAPSSYRRHLVDTSKIACPVILSEIFQNTLPVVDIGFVGQLSKDDLAAAALATVWFNLWNTAMLGFMTAVDTLLSQSYGAGRFDGFAVWTGSSMIIVFVATFIVAGIVACCGPAMRAFGQEPDLADAAGEFSYRLIPGLFPYYLFKVLTKYLQTQNSLAPAVWIGVLANVRKCCDSNSLHYFYSSLPIYIYCWYFF